MNQVEIKYFKEIKKIENLYYNTIKDLSNKYPTPLNGEEEKKKFFKAIADDKFYNPQLKFETQKIDPKIFKILENAKINTNNDIYGFKKIYKDRIKQKINELKYFETWGTQESTNYSILAKGKPSFLLLQKAKSYARKYKRHTIKFSRITPVELAEELKQEVKELTGINLKVEFVHLFNKMSISASDHKIKINPNETFKSIDLKRLKVHEIGTHFLRYFNGEKTGIKILEIGTANYIETEEGLAAYMEEIKGVQTTAQMYIYAGRVIATYYCTKKSFYEVFQILKKYGYKDKDAYAITYRAKRNLSDTSQKGGYTKDYVYFSGYIKIKKFVKNGGNIKDLFIGKIKIEDLKPMKKFIQEHKDQITTIFDKNYEI